MEKSCKNCRFKHNTSNDRCFACEKNIASGWQPYTNRQWLASLSDEELARKIDHIKQPCEICSYGEDFSEVIVKAGYDKVEDYKKEIEDLKKKIEHMANSTIGLLKVAGIGEEE